MANEYVLWLFMDVCSQGLPEDSHYTLLSDMAGLVSLLASSFVPSTTATATASNPGASEGGGQGQGTGAAAAVGGAAGGAVNLPVLAGMAVDPLRVLGTLRTLGGSSSSSTRQERVLANEKVLIKQAQDSCSFVFDFPTYEIDPSSALRGGVGAEVSGGEDRDDSANQRCFDDYNV
jgi:hypothetical protein